MDIIRRGVSLATPPFEKGGSKNSPRRDDIEKMFSRKDTFKAPEQPHFFFFIFFDLSEWHKMYPLLYRYYRQRFFCDNSPFDKGGSKNSPRKDDIEKLMFSRKGTLKAPEQKK